MSNAQTETGTTRRMELDRRALEEIRHLVREGWVRSLVVRDRGGRELIRMPLLVGLAAGALAPVWAALGAVAGLAAGCTVDLVLQEPQPALWPPEPPPDVDEDENRGGLR